MDTKQAVLDILNELTGEDLSDQMDENIFENGLLDSMATVQMLLELQDKCGVTAPVSEFHREDWDTPNKIIAKNVKRIKIKSRNQKDRVICHLFQKSLIF